MSNPEVSKSVVLVGLYFLRFCFFANSLHQYLTLFFSCTSPSDDPFRACFGCENDKTKRNSNHPRFLNFIDRQSGEVFQATSQNRRVICGKDPLGNMRCRLRIDRAMQLRRVSYGRALQFIQSEQYLGDDDVSLIR